VWWFRRPGQWPRRKPPGVHKARHISSPLDPVRHVQTFRTQTGTANQNHSEVWPFHLHQRVRPPQSSSSALPMAVPPRNKSPSVPDHSQPLAQPGSVLIIRRIELANVSHILDEISRQSPAVRPGTIPLAVGHIGFLADKKKEVKHARDALHNGRTNPTRHLNRKPLERIPGKGIDSQQIHDHRRRREFQAGRRSGRA